MSIFTIRRALAVASIVALTPVSAFAATSWSGVVVDQSQSANTPNSQADLQQTAVIHTWTELGNQAASSASASGTQGLWATGKANQSQTLTASAGLDWQTNTWPATAVASSDASVRQDQAAWSNLPIKEQQTGGIWLRNNVGANQANSDATASQTNFNVVGDAIQHQFIGGQAHADGFVKPSVPSCGCSGSGWFGGQFVQDVAVFVHNIFTF